MISVRKKIPVTIDRRSKELEKFFKGYDLKLTAVTNGNMINLLDDLKMGKYEPYIKQLCTVQVSN